MLDEESKGITRAEVAKSVSLLFHSQEELSEWENEKLNTFFDEKDKELWYVLYADFLYHSGIWQEEIIQATPEILEDVITYQEAYDTLKFVVDDNIELLKEMPISQEVMDGNDWWDLYDLIISHIAPPETIVEQTLLLYGVPSNVEGAKPWAAYTDLGIYESRGLTLDSYLDHEITVLVRENEVIRLIQDESESITYKNAWVLSGTEEALEVYIGEVRRVIPFQTKIKDIETVIHQIVDLSVDGGAIENIMIKTEKISNTILAISENGIEVEGYGTIALSEQYRVLKSYGAIEEKSLSDVLVGYDNYDLVLANGEITAILINGDFKADKIRVLLMDTDYQSKFHDEIQLISQEQMIISYGTEQEIVEPGTSIELTADDDRFNQGRILIETEASRGISVDSIRREQGIPTYIGRLEVLNTEDGLVLINDLYLEDYLKWVVPSEMPSNYEKEALKAQAICARTYAYIQIKENAYIQYGAHVDDSVNFQVYNNIQSNERTDEAIIDTYGQILTYQGEAVEAFYFSTSSGVTTDPAIWGSDPADTPYLKSVELQIEKKNPSFPSELDYLAFIKDKEISSFDAAYAFFRWNTIIDTTMLSDYEDEVGAVTSVEVIKRGAGGVAHELKIVGSKGKYVVVGQNAIREALGNEKLEIVKNDGASVTGWSMLPSGFISLESIGNDENGNLRYKIYGGGFGHGVGMSQNGAQGMAKDGMNHVEILEFFYEGIQILEQS